MHVCILTTVVNKKYLIVVKQEKRHKERVGGGKRGKRDGVVLMFEFHKKNLKW